ncbi:MAG: class I SAM-dependent methyltransferase [Burkholderiales bacterium]|jgi:hypothetical protein|nr:class I SAM-dependent methyltransferase [Burkholderiales bacterium]
MTELISEEYRKMQEELHRNPNYGVASVQYAPIVAQVLEQVRPAELLDYGAGKGRLGETLKTLMQSPPQIRHYDPARPEWAAVPHPAPFVACIDVLEHIEPERIDNVLDDLQRVTAGHGVFTVHTGPAVKVLSDGRNAHLIQQPPSWWLPRFMERFDLAFFQRMPQGFWIVVEAKPGNPAHTEPDAGNEPQGLLRRVVKSVLS